MFGFLLLMRFLSDRMASLGCTVLDLMMSEISRLRAMSSLRAITYQSGILIFSWVAVKVWEPSYRLLLVAFSICSSRALLAPEDHQPIILTG